MTSLMPWPLSRWSDCTFVASPTEFPAQPDLIILPGTKNTLSDLAWLWRQGLAQHIRQCLRMDVLS